MHQKAVRKVELQSYVFLQCVKNACNTENVVIVESIQKTMMKKLHVIKKMVMIPGQKRFLCG